MTKPQNRMIVPQFWAEVRLQKREKKKQVTIRRFGWSDTSQEEAQANANQRAEEALARALAGEKLLRREPKVAYNGAHGMPIREEILSRQGDTIITRNSYGARCLNTPNVLFADIDFEERFSGRYFLIVFAALILCAVMLGVITHSVRLAIILWLVSMLFSIHATLLLHKTVQQLQGGANSVARKKIEDFLTQHPEWKLRLYQTPAGMRVMVTHRTFEPDDPKVLAFFKAIGTDKIYMRMCINQQCFRARVSAKPWRIGIEKHMKPRPGTWPVAEDKLPERTSWVEAYEAKAQKFAACRFVETIGKGVTHPDVATVQEWHDELCGAASQNPLA
jgi:hypothetical protein